MMLVRAYLRKIALLAVKQEQRNTVDLFENQRTAVSAVAIRTYKCDGGLVTWTEPKAALKRSKILLIGQIIQVVVLYAVLWTAYTAFGSVQVIVLTKPPSLDR